MAEGSDNYPAYFPPLSDPVDLAWIPCLVCGAMVLQRLAGQHVLFHEER